MFAILSEDFPDGWVTWKSLGSLVSKYECKPRASYQVVLEPNSRSVPQISFLFYYLGFEAHQSLQPFLWLEFSSEFKAKALRREAIWPGWGVLCLRCKRFISNVIIVSLAAYTCTRSEKKTTGQRRSTQQRWAAAAVSVTAMTSRLEHDLNLYMKMHLWNTHHYLFGVKPGSFLPFLSGGAFGWKTCQRSLKR